MLDLVQVLTKGGLVLWAREFAELRRSISHPVDALITDILVEERAGIEHYDTDCYRVQWTFANDLGLIFVVVYQKILQLTYIDELLELMKTSFVQMFAETVKATDQLQAYDFDEAFDIILTGLEDKALQEKKPKAPRKFQDSKKFANTLESNKTKDLKATESANDSGSESASSSPANDIAAKLKKLQLAKNAKKGSGKKDASPKKEDSEDKKKKVLRSWGDGNVPQDGGKKLDFSESTDEHEIDKNALGTRTSDGLYEAPEMETIEDDEDEIPESDSKSSSDRAKQGSSFGLFSFIRSFTEQKALTEESLSPILTKMKEHLIAKNVASEIADTLCNSVSSSLIGQKHSSFSSLNKTVKAAMEVALKRILTPRTSTDILRDIMAAKAQGRPYTFVFIGVNGVGKSTNLSKVCFWLLQNGLKVLIAACDTFRSGAVEQLRVHARNLKALESGAVVDLYERGYGKDSANIAKDAISFGLSVQLVALNTPDKIIFVGEALVGNEAVDQLTKFNQALRDFSGMANPRQVDGIILTKFDTVDDKVGAALSMTYITGQPILFVGTGQTYTDLKRMNVKSIVTTLLA
ncbi:hypothetical protein HDU96_007301 [Phlyctochytrium bullatum]|nr:hypothetical protein HDU96_007301 [Phlyctochytrium bullatum]